MSHSARRRRTPQGPKCDREGLFCDTQAGPEANARWTARQVGFTAMQFNFVVSSNDGAVRLWQRCGLRIVGQVPGAFRHRERGAMDVFIMHRFL